MKEKEKKLRLNTFEAGETQRLADYLNEMAKKGWRIRKISWAFLHFVREEKEQGRYTVDIFHRTRHKKKKEYIDLCGEAGWEYVGNNSDMYIFRAGEGENPVPIQTDPQMEYQAFRRALLPIDLLFLAFAIYFLSSGIMLTFFMPQSLFLISPGQQLIVAAYLVLSLFYLIYVFGDFYWLARQRRQLRQGRKLRPMPRAIIRTRQVSTLLMLACFLACVAILWAYDVKQEGQNAAVPRDAAPVLQLADLGAEAAGPDGTEEEWKGESGGEIPLHVFYREEAAENEDVFIWMDYYRAKDGKTAERVYEVLLSDQKRFAGAVEAAELSESWQTEEGVLLIRPGDSETEPRRSGVLLRKGNEVWELRGSFDLSDAETIARCRQALCM